MLKFGLLGKSLSHSFSKTFFFDLFQKNNIQGEYVNFEIPSIEYVSEILNDENLKGLNVTIPYKQEIVTYLDKLSDDALKIGAVNVVQFKDGLKIGHNTDAFGFHQSITRKSFNYWKWGSFKSS